jgi:predicted secreted Zn-dependent protease
MIFWVTLGTALLWPAPLGAQIPTHISYRFYTIAPQKIQELPTELDRRSPIVYQGRKYHGYTQWWVNWQFYWHEYPTSCQITQVKTTLKVVYTLPKLLEKSAGNTSLKKAFDRYYQALFNHEQNHKNHGLEAALVIKAKLENLSSFPTCQDLNHQANDLAQSLIRTYRQKDLDYDRRTEHGRLEGAVIHLYIP